MLTLYYWKTSYGSHKALLYLAEKGIPWQRHLINLRNNEQITSDYRKINPNVTVPAIVDDDGTTICNSTDLIEYLEKKHPENPLLPKDPQQRVLVHRICKEHEALHNPYIRDLSYHNIFMTPERLRNMDIQKALAVIAKHPNPKHRAFLESALQGNIPQTDIDAANQAVKDALNQMEKRLEENGGKFMVGDHYTVADVICTATLFRLEKIGFIHEIDQHPLIKKWYGDMQERPSFKTAILNDWPADTQTA